jgi:outer membrane protein assembly factor BamB
MDDEVRRAVRTLLGVFAALAVLLSAAPAAAALQPGEILVADSGFTGLIRVNPLTGKQTPFAANAAPVNASSPLFAIPSDVVIAPTGRIFAVDYSGFDGNGGVIEVDPETGKQTKIAANDQPVNASSQYFNRPTGIALLPSGRILVADRNAFGGVGGVIAVDLATGKQTVFSSNQQPVNAASQLFGDPRGGITVLRTGTVLVGNGGADPRGVIAIDPTTGKQSRFSTNDQAVNASSRLFEIPVGVIEGASGGIFVADQNGPVEPDPLYFRGGLIGVNPATGKQRTVSSNQQAINAGAGFLSDPFDLAFGLGGRILIADTSAFGGSCPEGCGGIIAVDPATGKQAALSTNDQPLNASTQLYEGPSGIAVMPPRCQGRLATIVGTPRGEKITGTPGSDVIAALAGKDRVSALRGNDRVCGGRGADLIRGGRGRDRLLGEAGRDGVFGGPGPDLLKGGRGRDLLRGGPGRDVLFGGGGKDRLRGGPGRDRQKQ